MDGTGPSELDQEAENWGLDPIELKSLFRRDGGQTGVWPVNAPATRAFLSVCNQWRTVSLGLAGAMVTGLDYTAARAGLDMAGISVTPELWAQIQAIESGALAEMKEG